MEPRLFGLPASDADVVAVIRRGPADWSAVGRWDVAGGSYEQGAWLRGRLYPQRCDLSPDGRWLCFFALNPSARWELGWTYVGVSRLPWLYALAAWRTDGTWTRGAHFAADAADPPVAPPDLGSLPSVALAVTAAASYAVERRRGWTEAPGSTPRAADDMWDERRAPTLRMCKERPGGGARLEVTGVYAAFRSGADTGDVAYRVVEREGAAIELRGVQWAEWSRDGRLLVATRAGDLETRTHDSWATAAETVASLAALQPAPVEAPPTARSWG
jgi:hypothetical protein